MTRRGYYCLLVLLTRGAGSPRGQQWFRLPTPLRLDAYWVGPDDNLLTLQEG